MKDPALRPVSPVLEPAGAALTASVSPEAAASAVTGATGAAVDVLLDNDESETTRPDLGSEPPDASAAATEPVFSEVEPVSSEAEVTGVASIERSTSVCVAMSVAMSAGMSGEVSSRDPDDEPPGPEDAIAPAESVESDTLESAEGLSEGEAPVSDSADSASESDL